MITKFLILFTACLCGLSSAVRAFDGPLRLNQKNPRYFTDASGRAIYLAGSHTWENFQDATQPGEPPFDYPAYLEMMATNGHNFMRFWTWEQTKMGSWSSDEFTFSPMPWVRTGPGLANDGMPRFDLTNFDPEYFRRMRERVILARDKGIYTSIMLFQGWALPRRDSPDSGNPFPYLPMNAANNINGISVVETPHDYDDKPGLHTLKGSPDLLRVQEAFVLKVIETVNDLDNVLYEVINEGGSIEWQHHIIRFVKEREAGLPKQHPVGMTYRWSPAHLNSVLFDSPADWISPNEELVDARIGTTSFIASYKHNPPEANGKKVIVSDTDHLWGHGGTYQWVWKSFFRGLNVLFMDPWEPLPGKKDVLKTIPWLHDFGGIAKDARDYPDWELVRRHIGYTRQWSEKIDLNVMVPHGELSSTLYCLANPGQEYLVYFPESREAQIDLRGTQNEFTVEWFLPLLNKSVPGPMIAKGGDFLRLHSPISLDCILHLKRK